MFYNLKTRMSDMSKIKLSAYNYVGGFFMFGDSLFKRVEKKTNVSKDTILSLASKLQTSDMKDEATLRNLIDEISELTGKKVSKEKSDKIIDTILKDKVPKIDKMI